MIRTAVGIDLGGSFIKYGVVSISGDILYEEVIPTPSGSRNNVIDAICECQRNAIHRNPKVVVECTGIGTPGIVDIAAGVVKGAAFQLPQWEGLPLADLVSAESGLPTYVDNDGNLMGLGEYQFGKHPKAKSIIFLTIGTAIGGAIILDGKLYRGASNAVELGVIPFTWDGKDGYWEDFASTRALVARYAVAKGYSDKDQLNGKIIFDAAYAGDSLATKLLQEHVDMLGRGIGGYINILNPDQVIVGGGVSESAGTYIADIRKASIKYALEHSRDNVEILPASLGNKAGMLGAGYFALTENERGTRTE